MWQAHRDAAHAFWGGTEDLEGVLRTAVQQAGTRDARMYLTFAAAVAALTAARLGDEQQARQLAAGSPVRGEEAALLANSSTSSSWFHRDDPTQGDGDDVPGQYAHEAETRARVGAAIFPQRTTVSIRPSGI